MARSVSGTSAANALGIGGKGFFSLGGTPANSQTFNMSGTWTKPTAPAGKSILSITITVVAGGGGGSSGGAFTNGAPTDGGGGGGGGGYAKATYLPAAINATETVTVGPGGTGGAAVVLMSFSGNPGNDGVDGSVSSFGAHMTANGGGHGVTLSGNSAPGGTANVVGGSDVTTTQGGLGGKSKWNIGPGNGAAAGNAGPGGGGGGNVNLVYTGSNGGVSGAGGNAGIGVTNTSAAATDGGPGCGGGGAGSNTNRNLTSGAGGNGASPGAGGGAGGGTATPNFSPGNVNTAKKGGDGASGQVVVVTTFG